MRDAFYQVRDNIQELTKSCADNIQVAIYFRGVLSEPVVVTVGKGENVLRIDIESNGKISYQWTATTASAWVSSFFGGVKSFTEDFINKNLNPHQNK